MNFLSPDGNGDTDVLSASSLDDKIAWYEQLDVADPQNPDTDGDGFTDGAEVAAGSDPLDPGSTPPASVPSASALGRSVLGGLMAFLGWWTLAAGSRPRDP